MKRLTTRQINRIQEMRSEGLTLKEIAKKFKRSINTVSRYASGSKKAPNNTISKTIAPSATVNIIPVTVFLKVNQFTDFVTDMNQLGYDCSDIKFIEK